MSPPLLTAAETRQLEGFRLGIRRTFGGRVRGERLSRKKGVSIEFADFRPYTDGDDLRHFDWNVLARLDSQVVRTYQDEQDLAVYLVLDTSASMDFGSPTKFEMARKVLVALGWVGLRMGDAVFPVALSAVGTRAAPLRGRSGFRKLSEWAATIAPGASYGLAEAIGRFARSDRRAGLAIIASDGLDPEFPLAVRGLAARGYEVWHVEILSAVDLNPDLEGDLKLVDAESEVMVEITASRGVLQAYRQNLEAHRRTVHDAMRRVQGRRIELLEREPLSETLARLRRAGWLVR